MLAVYLSQNGTALLAWNIGRFWNVGMDNCGTTVQLYRVDCTHVILIEQQRALHLCLGQSVDLPPSKLYPLGHLCTTRSTRKNYAWTTPKIWVGPSFFFFRMNKLTQNSRRTPRLTAFLRAYPKPFLGAKLHTVGPTWVLFSRTPWIFNMNPDFPNFQIYMKSTEFLEQNLI